MAMAFHHPSARRDTILLVDDHREILDFIADDLGDHYAVLQASHGGEALNVLAKNPVDLIVSDIMMPVLDGHGLCAKVKKSIGYGHIPFIMLTAKNSLTAKIAGLESGADAYVEKPFSPSFLQAQIRNLLKNRRFMREHYWPPLSDADDEDGTDTEPAFLDRLQQLILEHIEDDGLCVDMLAEKMHISRPTLYRRIRALSSLSPNDLIIITRLKKAAELLCKGDRERKVYEVSLMVGFNSSSNFIRNFRKHYGLSPKEWQQRNAT